MLKIKIYRLSSGYRKFDNNYQPVSDYCYCIYVFGILIHSVTLHDVHRDSVKTIFGNKPILKSTDK